MKQIDKIRFIRVLQELDDTLNIREEILPKLKEKLNNKTVNEKEKIVLDLVEGINKNNSFLIDILKEIETNEIIEEINKRVETRNPDEISKVEKRHVQLVKILLKNNLIESNVSEKYIANTLNILVNLTNTGTTYNYFKNPTATSFQNTIQKIVFSEQTIIDLFLFHILNLHTNGKLAEFLNQPNRQNHLKILIASYIKISTKEPETQKLIVPLSIVMIFTNVYNQLINLYRFGNVNTNEIFNIINQHTNLESSFTNYLNILKEFNLLYDFLIKIKNSLNQINNEDYIKKILKIILIILDNDLYSEKLLIDFSILFSSKVPDEYEKIIRQESEKNNYWYKDFVVEKLESEEELLHDEVLNFLQFIENWHENEELKEKIKEFLKNNINQLLENDSIFNIYKILLKHGEKFELNYTSKDIGKILIETFLNLNENNEKLIYIFEKIDKLFKKKDLTTFKSKLWEEIINNLEILNEYQYNTLEKSKVILKINKNQIEELFKKLIDIRDNEKSFSLFKLVVANNKRKLNKSLKKDFTEKLEDIKENVKNENAVKSIEEILAILK